MARGGGLATTHNVASLRPRGGGAPRPVYMFCQPLPHGQVAASAAGGWTGGRAAVRASGRDGAPAGNGGGAAAGAAATVRDGDRPATAARFVVLLYPHNAGEAGAGHLLGGRRRPPAGGVAPGGETAAAGSVTCGVLRVEERGGGGAAAALWLRGWGRDGCGRRGGVSGVCALRGAGSEGETAALCLYPSVTST